MPFRTSTKRSDEVLQQVAQQVTKARRVVLVTGAGISTSCGIPVSSPETNLHDSTHVDNNRIFAPRMGSIVSFQANSTLPKATPTVKPPTMHPPLPPLFVEVRIYFNPASSITQIRPHNSIGPLPHSENTSIVSRAPAASTSSSGFYVTKAYCCAAIHKTLTA
jgi:hypothetical protein